MSIIDFITRQETLWIWLGSALIGLFGIGAALHALLRKADPRSALGWIAIALAIPLIGPIFYLLFGINRIKTRAADWRLRGRWRRKDVKPEEAEALEFPEPLKHYPESLQSLMRLGAAVTGLSLRGPCHIEPLFNGEVAYPAMLEAIEAAERYVLLSTYIFETDVVGRRFVDALERAQSRGVEVRVLMDGFGALYSRPRIMRWLRRARITHAVFLPPRFSNVYINLRTHRKILVVDGRVGFTGGMNLGRRHLLQDPENRKPTQDLHFRLQGPILRHLEGAFYQDYRFASHGELAPFDPLPSEVGSGQAYCRGLISGPNEDYDKIRLVLMGAFQAAQRKIHIMTPYFIPDAAMLSALVTAQLRGVEVALILPETNNLPFVHWASQGLVGELLQHGVAVHYQRGAFAHTKYLIIDETYSLIGSANLDPRSLQLNFEFNVEIYDTALNARLSAHFQQTRAQSRKVELEAWRRRPFLHRLRDAVAKLGAPYL